MLLFIAACNIETQFPEGLEPLDTEVAPFEDLAAGDEHPETLALESRTGDDGNWTHARGYIHAPVTEVWDALKLPDVCTDRRGVTSYTFTLDTDPAYAVSFRVHNVVVDLVTLEFDNDWRQGVVTGTDDAPKIVGVRWQKTSGSELVKVLEGSVVVTRVDEQTTQLDMVEHLQAIQTTTADTEAFLQDFYDSALAITRGEPLPTYTE